jgi:hypothetical protein
MYAQFHPNRLRQRLRIPRLSRLLTLISRHGPGIPAFFRWLIPTFTVLTCLYPQRDDTHPFSHMFSPSVASPSRLTYVHSDGQRPFDLWADAVRIYQDHTGISLNADTNLARRLASCKTEFEVLDAVEDTAVAFSMYRRGNPKLKKLRDVLKPLVGVVLLTSDAGAESPKFKVRLPSLFGAPVLMRSCT